MKCWFSFNLHKSLLDIIPTFAQIAKSLRIWSTTLFWLHKDWTEYSCGQVCKPISQQWFIYESIFLTRQVFCVNSPGLSPCTEEPTKTWILCSHFLDIRLKTVSSQPQPIKERKVYTYQQEKHNLNFQNMYCYMTNSSNSSCTPLPMSNTLYAISNYYNCNYLLVEQEHFIFDPPHYS